MKQQQTNQIENFVSRRVSSGKLRRVVAMLSAFVLFTTMNTLKFDADTLERVAACGMQEHIHLAECYDADGVLTCALPEHVHTDACYQQRPTTDDVAVTRIDEYVPLNAQVNLVSDFEADDDWEVVSEPVDEDVDETETELENASAAAGNASDDGAFTVDDGDTDPVAQETLAADTPAEEETLPEDEKTEYVYEIGEQAQVLLSTVLDEAGLEIGDISDAGAAKSDEDLISVQADEEDDDYVVTPLVSFEKAEIVVIAADGDYVIALTNAVVTEEAQDEKETETETDEIEKFDTENTEIEKDDAAQVETDETGAGKTEEVKSDENEDETEEEKAEEEEVDEENTDGEETEEVTEEENNEEKSDGDETDEEKSDEEEQADEEKSDEEETDEDKTDEEETDAQETVDAAILQNDSVTIVPAGDTSLSANTQIEYSENADKQGVVDMLNALLSANAPRKLMKAARGRMMAAASADSVDSADNGGQIVDYAVFDISLLDEGVEQSETGEVDVLVRPQNVNIFETLPENATVTNVAYTLYHIHDNNVETLPVNVDCGEDGTLFAVDFTTDKFSYFVLKYTVEFYYEDDEVVIEGGTQILLSELMRRLGFDIDIYDIAKVEFSNSDLIEVEMVSGMLIVNETEIDVGEKDFLLTSKAPFTTKEELTITLEDGTKLVINTTDATYTDLNKFLTDYDVVDDRQSSVMTEDGKIITKIGGNYMLNLHFKESQDVQFENNSILDFTIPDGVELNNSVGTGAEFKITIGSRAITGNKITIVEGSDEKKHVQIEFNKNHKNYSYLQTSSDVSFDLSFGVTFNKTTIEKAFKDDESGTITIEQQDKHNASVVKRASFNADDGKIYYKVTVHSTDGDSKNVKLIDTITGSALKLDTQYGNQGVQVYYSDEYGNNLNNGQSVECSDYSIADKSLAMTIANVPKDQSVTIEYAAKVDYDEIAKSGNATFSETGNTAKIEVPGDDNPDDNESKHEESNITFSTVSKEATATSEAKQDGEGAWYRLVTYKVIANPERKASLKGSKITDLLNTGADMSYYREGDYAQGLSIKVIGEDGNEITGSGYPRLISWNELGVTGDDSKTWAYNVPADDGKYSYEVTYQVKVPIKEIGESADDVKYVKNTAETKHGSSTVEVPVTPKKSVNYPTMKKVVDSIDGDKVTWKIFLSVPAEGYDKPYTVTDTLPTMSTNGTIHDIVTDVRVDGIVEGDGFNKDNNVVITEEDIEGGSGTKSVAVTFSKFVETASDRTVTITVETQANPQWLEALRQNPGSEYTYKDHTNTAKAQSEGKDIGTSAPSAQVLTKNVVKKNYLANDGTNVVALTTDEELEKYNDEYYRVYKNYPYYMFTVQLQGVTEDYLVIEDYFDTDIFELYDEATMSRYLQSNYKSAFDESAVVYGGSNKDAGSKSDNKATLISTDTGVEIIIDKPPKDPATGFVYSYISVNYFVVVKDQAKLDALMKAASERGTIITDENGNKVGKKFVTTNTAEWGEKTSQVEYGYTIKDVLKKDGSYDASKGEASFTIKLNPNKAIINGGVNFDLTDIFENITIESKEKISITAKNTADQDVPSQIFDSKSDADTWCASNKNYEGIIAYIDAGSKKIIVEEIPDATSVVITYTGKSDRVARIEDGQAKEELSNKVTVLDYDYTWSQTNNYDFISKTKSADVDADGYLTFTIDFNPNKLKLKNGNTIDVTDAYTGGLSVDESTFKVVCDPNTNAPSAETILSSKKTEDYSDSYGSGKKYTFTVPDETHVTITYKAKPSYTVSTETDDRGLITTDYRNTAEAENVPKVVTGGGDDFFLTKHAGSIETNSDDYNGMIPFTIVYNPMRIEKNGGNPITLTDEFTNLLVEYSTIHVTLEPAGNYDYDYSGNVGTFIVPDSTKVTIQYYARPDYTSGSAVKWFNTVKATGYEASEDGESDETISGEGRGSLGNVLWLMKYETGHMSIRLPNVTFKLFMDDGQGGMTPVTRDDGTQVTFTTEADNPLKGKGFVHMTLVTPAGGSPVKDEFTNGAEGFKEDTIYFLQEETQLEGYYSNTETYNFVLHHTTKENSEGEIVRLPDYVKPSYMTGKSVYVFGADDIVKVANEKISQSVTVKKNWVNADDTWSWPEDIKKVTVKIQKKDGENNIDLTGSNAPNYYVDDGVVKTGEDGTTWSDTLELTRDAPNATWNHLDMPEERDAWTYVVSEISITTKDDQTVDVVNGKATVTVDGIEKVFNVDNGTVSNGKATVTNIEEKKVEVRKEWNGVQSTVTFDVPAGAVAVDTSKVVDGKITVNKSDLIVRVKRHRYGYRAGDRLDTAPYAEDVYMDLTSPNWSYSWTGLPAGIMENGVETDYRYEVTEEMVTVPTTILHQDGNTDGYVDISNVFVATESTGVNGEVIITNALADDVNWYLEVEKEWRDSEGRPTTGGSVEFQLLRDSSTTTVSTGGDGTVKVNVRMENGAGEDNTSLGFTEIPVGSTVTVKNEQYYNASYNYGTYTETKQINPTIEVYYWDTQSNVNWHHWQKDENKTVKAGNQITFVVDKDYCILLKWNYSEDDLALLKEAGLSITYEQKKMTTTTTGQVLKPNDSSDPYNGAGLVVDTTGNYKFTLSPDSPISFMNLPWKETSGNSTSTYTYRVVETSNPDGWHVVTREGTYNPAPAEGETKGQSGSIKLVNQYDQPQTGSLKLTKNVQYNGQSVSDTSADGTYIFTIKDSAEQAAVGKVNGTAISNGQVSVTITNGQSQTVEVTDLAPGDYVIEEINIPTDVTLTTAGGKSITDNKVTVTVEAGKSGDQVPNVGIATFTNNKTPTTDFSFKKVWTNGVETSTNVTWPSEVSSITVKVQRRKGENGAIDQNFELGYTLTDSAITAGTTKVPNGESTPAAQFVGSSNNTYAYKITNLQKLGSDNTEWVYFVTETSDVSGYHVTYVDSTGDFVKDNGTIRNDQNSYTLPSTGGVGTTIFYGAGLALMMFAFLGFVLTARKRSEGDGI